MSSASEGQNTIRGFSSGPGVGTHGVRGAELSRDTGEQQQSCHTAVGTPRGCGDTPALLPPPPALSATLLSHRPSHTAPAPSHTHQALTSRHFNPKPRQEPTPKKPSLTSPAGFHPSNPPAVCGKTLHGQGLSPGAAPSEIPPLSPSSTSVTQFCLFIASSRASQAGDDSRHPLGGRDSPWSSLGLVFSALSVSEPPTPCAWRGQ